MSTHEHQGRYIRNSLRPHEGTFRVARTMDETSGSLEDVGDESCHPPPAQVRRQFDLSNCFQVETKGLSPGPRPGLISAIAPKDRGHCSKDHWLIAAPCAPEIWRGNGKLRNFRVADGWQRPLWRFPWRRSWETKRKSVYRALAGGLQAWITW